MKDAESACAGGNHGFPLRAPPLGLKCLIPPLFHTNWWADLVFAHLGPWSSSSPLATLFGADTTVFCVLVLWNGVARLFGLGPGVGPSPAILLIESHKMSFLPRIINTVCCRSLDPFFLSVAANSLFVYAGRFFDPSLIAFFRDTLFSFFLAPGFLSDFSRTSSWKKTRSMPSFLGFLLDRPRRPSINFF